MVFVWPAIQEVLNAFSKNMIHTNPTISAFIFGLIERALIPFGLHHIGYEVNKRNSSLIVIVTWYIWIE